MTRALDRSLTKLSPLVSIRERLNNKAAAEKLFSNWGNTIKKELKSKRI